MQESAKTTGTISQKLTGLFIPNKGNDFWPRVLRGNFLMYVVLAVLLIKIATLTLYLPLPQNLFFANITKIDLLNLLNQNRQSLGLNPLNENKTLDAAAFLKAQDMVKNGYFAHQSPAGITPWFWFLQAGYKYKYAGENLAVGFVDSKTVYDAWFNSPSHKENLLNSHYTDVGTAVLTGFQGNSIIVVQEFGSPMVKPKPTVTAAPTAPTTPPAPPTTTTATIKPAPVATIAPVSPAPKPALAPAPAAPIALNSETTNTSNTSTSAAITKVLGQSTQYIVAPENAAKTGDSPYLQFLNFIVYDTNTIFYYFSYSVLLILLVYLFVNVILMSGVQNRAMIVRPLLLVALLVISLWLNKDVLAYILPYQINI